MLCINHSRLSDRNTDQHRWYYYPQMKKNEVILFKQWDSDTTLKGELLSVIYILILNQIISHLPNTERPRLTFGQFPLWK